MAKYQDFYNRKRPLTTNELLAELENLDTVGGHNIDVFVTPPNEIGEITDEDSGDEDANNPDHLSRRQLEAEAELEIDKRITELEDLEGENTDEDEILEPEPKKKLLRQAREWIVGDLQAGICDTWEYSMPPPLCLCSESEPLDFFMLFMPSNVVENIVKETVAYAASRNRSFTLSVDEMYVFLAILYLTGYNVLPRKKMYWEEQEDVHNILVSQSMRRNKFIDIFQNIHFIDNQHVDATDKMSKVRWLINELNSIYLRYVPLEQSISIDESMVPYFGRHGCKQFIKGKPIRFGYKAWVMALKNGYCINFDIYQGRNVQYKNSNVGLGESVVLNFCNILKENYPNLKFSLYCDNFFTSAKLITELTNIGYGCTGTVRDNRTEKSTLPDVSTYKKKDRGSFDSTIDAKNNIVAVRWKDNSTVTLLSNQYGCTPTQTATRYSAQQKKKINIKQPFLISQYNKNMGGVDQLDNNISNYRIGIRGKKWYMPLVLWMFDTAMNNAWILSRYYGCTIDNLGFRRQVVQAILKDYGKKSTRSTPCSKISVPSNVRRGAEHYISVNQPRRRCAQCSNKTVKACAKCLVPLHDKCFSLFHEK